jgi:hypothetical protein
VLLDAIHTRLVFSSASVRWKQCARAPSHKPTHLLLQLLLLLACTTLLHFVPALGLQTQKITSRN